jgi:hypothetical protein
MPSVVGFADGAEDRGCRRDAEEALLSESCGTMSHKHGCVLHIAPAGSDKKSMQSLKTRGRPYCPSSPMSCRALEPGVCVERATTHLLERDTELPLLDIPRGQLNGRLELEVVLVYRGRNVESAQIEQRSCAAGWEKHCVMSMCCASSESVETVLTLAKVFGLTTARRRRVTTLAKKDAWQM